MPIYRKKPVKIEARQWLPDNPLAAGDVVGWLSANGHDVEIQEDFLEPGKKLAIRTLEGEITASPGDWVIQGVRGEFYPCKPDIFDATYEAV